MKLVYLSHWRYPAEKTHAQFAMNTCASFADKGIEVELWVPNRKNHIADDPFEYHNVEKKFKIVKIPCIDIMHLNDKIGFQLMVFSYARNIVKRAVQEPDSVFYAHDARDLYFVAGKVRSLYLEIHDFYDSKFSFITKKVFKHIRGFIVTNSIKLRRIRDTYGINEGKLLWQPNAVDLSQFDIPVSRQDARKKVGLPKDQNIVLYIGTLYRWKGVYTLAEAAKEIKGDVYFVGGPEKEQECLREFARKKGYSTVHFINRQPHELMPYFAKSANVLVLPNTAKDVASKYETSPVKLFEYLVSKTPIVASDIPSVRDIVSEEHVRFTTPDDPASFSTVINEVLASKEISKAQVDAGYTHVQQFSWGKRAETIMSFLSRTNA